MSGQKNIGQIVGKYRFVILGAVILAVASFFAFNKFFLKEKVYSGEVTVTYTAGKGFNPERIAVKKGTIVNFKNLGTKELWPASDFYPSDAIYPEFNSKKGILKDSTYSFKFEKVGSWGYHNDIYPIDKGVIVVTDGDVVLSVNSGCGNLETLAYSERQVCWYNQIKDVAKKQGVNAALKLVAKLYNQYPQFAGGCHDATHLIGDEAYRQFRKGKNFDFSVETSYCGYGFYHGFIEAMLYTTGDYAEVRKFCESINSNLKGNVESPNAIYSCYHGIGHSTFDAHDPALWGDENKMVTPAIKTCEKVTEGLVPEKTKQCVTGVFNALAIAYSNDLYKLKMNPKDPTWFCRTQKGVYKTSCFMEVAMTWINTTMGGGFVYKFQDGVKFIATIGDTEGEKASIYSLASDYVRLHMNELQDKDMAENCRTIKSVYSQSCIEGTGLALLNWGKPGEEYVRALSFCGQTATNIQKQYCYQFIFRNFPNLYSKDKRLTICNSAVPADYKQLCINEGVINPQ